MVNLVHDLIYHSANRSPHAEALSYQGQIKSYEEIAYAIERCAQYFLAAGLSHHERVAVYLEKRIETVVARRRADATQMHIAPEEPLQG